MTWRCCYSCAVFGGGAPSSFLNSYRMFSCQKLESFLPVNTSPYSCDVLDMLLSTSLLPTCASNRFPPVPLCPRSPTMALSSRSGAAGASELKQRSPLVGRTCAPRPPATSSPRYRPGNSLWDYIRPGAADGAAKRRPLCRRQRTHVCQPQPSVRTIAPQTPASVQCAGGGGMP